MLFNSYAFIFLFLPLGLIGFCGFSFFRKTYLVVVWLIFISLAFYFFWSPLYLLLLLGSIVINWLMGELLQKSLLWSSSSGSPLTQHSFKPKGILAVGISFNLALLGYFKYFNFFVSNLNDFGLSLSAVRNLVLPLAISFYTFQQISYLVGIFNGRGMTHKFLNYLLFVAFFPQLIAGPIVNPEEMIPQFRQLRFGLNARNLSLGLTIASIGLFKKTVIADSIAAYATPIFSLADQGESISFLVAWQAAIAYTLQLYFDFSGYSDMAVGLAKMFNLKLPMNFFSPYKAISISDFWRRWHISLSRFLRDYLYIPLGGSRKGELRRHFNLLLTMLLGGLWHGASWTFVVWGGIHGLYLCIDHGWQQLLNRWEIAFNGWYYHWLARLLTFLAVVVSWVIFRAETFRGAWRVLLGMAGRNGVILPTALSNQFSYLRNLGIQFGNLDGYGELNGLLVIILGLFVVFFLPNVYQFMARESVVLDVYHHLPEDMPSWYCWRPNFGYALSTAAVLLAGLFFCRQPSEFLYFQF